MAFAISVYTYRIGYWHFELCRENVKKAVYGSRFADIYRNPGHGNFTFQDQDGDGNETQYLGVNPMNSREKPPSAPPRTLDDGVQSAETFFGDVFGGESSSVGTGVDMKASQPAPAAEAASSTLGDMWKSSFGGAASASGKKSLQLGGLQALSRSPQPLELQTQSRDAYVDAPTTIAQPGMRSFHYSMVISICCG